MIVIKLFSVIFLMQLVGHLNAHEDIFSASSLELVDYFDDESVEVKGREEREAIEAASDDNRLASIISQSLSRANHYWTRKRGGEKSTTPEAPLGAYQHMVYATKYPYVANRLDSRRKREVMRKFAQLNQLSSRQKRRAEIEAGAAEANLKKENSGSESVHHEVSSVDEGSKDLIKPSEVPNDGPHSGGHREGHKKKPVRKNFGRRL